MSATIQAIASLADDTNVAEGLRTWAQRVTAWFEEQAQIFALQLDGSLHTLRAESRYHNGGFAITLQAYTVDVDGHAISDEPCLVAFRFFP